MPIEIPKADHLRDLFSLKGKVVCVTGASGPTGIGTEVSISWNTDPSSSGTALPLTLPKPYYSKSS